MCVFLNFIFFSNLLVHALCPFFSINHKMFLLYFVSVLCILNDSNLFLYVNIYPQPIFYIWLLFWQKELKKKNLLCTLFISYMFSSINKNFKYAGVNEGESSCLWLANLNLSNSLIYLELKLCWCVVWIKVRNWFFSSNLLSNCPNVIRWIILSFPIDPRCLSYHKLSFYTF